MKWAEACGTATCVLLGFLLSAVCGTGLFIILFYVVTGNHGASLSTMWPGLLVTTWGFVCGVVLPYRTVWSTKCFIAWAAATCVGLVLGASTGLVSWTTAIGIVAVLALLSLAVALMRRAAQ